MANFVLLFSKRKSYVQIVKIYKVERLGEDIRYMRVYLTELKIGGMEVEEGNITALARQRARQQIQQRENLANRGG